MESIGGGACLADYAIVGQLGIGGMATVHRAEIETDGERRFVAVKRLHEYLAEDPENVAILRDEARLASCIRHPNVVRVLDLVEREGEAPVLVMECVEGIDLATLSSMASKAGVRMPLDIVAALTRDVLEGLHAAHEATRDDGLRLEIIHRDVSPQNILVGFDGVTRLTDFGIAKAAWRQQTTQLGAIKGKLGYMAPEQLDGRVDRRSDLYSAGVVVWELLTGSRFRASDGGPQLLVQVLHAVATPPSQHAADATLLDEVVVRAIQRDPDERFATAAEMARALVACITPASPQRVADFLASLRAAPRESCARPTTGSGVHIAGPSACADAPSARRPRQSPSGRHRSWPMLAAAVRRANEPSKMPAPSTDGAGCDAALTSGGIAIAS